MIGVSQNFENVPANSRCWADKSPYWTTEASLLEATRVASGTRPDRATPRSCGAREVVAGMVGAVDAAQARRLFAERRLPIRSIEVVWTADASMADYLAAQQSQINFLTENGDAP